MNSQAKLEISVVAAAISVGVLGDALLRSFPWGLNFALWAGLLAVAIFGLGRERQEAFAGGGWWLLLPIALAPLAFLWHDSLALTSLNLLALMTALSLAMLRSAGARLRVASLMQYVLGSLMAALHAGLGLFPLVLRDREWTSNFGWVELRKSGRVLLGTALAVPPLMVFGALFMGADAVFRTLVWRFVLAVPSHLVIVVFVAYAVGGYLRGLLFARERKLNEWRRLLPISLGAIEAAVMLSLLDLLFLVFVLVQVRYFFGGSALVQATTGLTYAEYARRGFFELVAVAALVLPLLLFTHWLLHAEDARALRLFRWLAGIQIGLLFVIMLSALQRMRLYEAEYGLSEQRLYPTAFMAWLAVVFVWFILTVLRGHRERFAFGAMVAGFLLIAALHVVNPDALIARTNLARARAGQRFDARYAAHLSADAVPELVAGLGALDSQDRCTLAAALLERWPPSAHPNWRSWSYTRAQAGKAVRDNEQALRAATCQSSH